MEKKRSISARQWDWAMGGRLVFLGSIRKRVCEVVNLSYQVAFSISFFFLMWSHSKFLLIRLSLRLNYSQLILIILFFLLLILVICVISFQPHWIWPWLILESPFIYVSVATASKLVEIVKPICTSFFWCQWLWFLSFWF